MEKKGRIFCDFDYTKGVKKINYDILRNPSLTIYSLDLERLNEYHLRIIPRQFIRTLTSWKTSFITYSSQLFFL